VNSIAAHSGDPQIACFGSSVGEVGLNAQILEQRTGHTVYNFCLDGTRFKQYNGLIHELNDYATNCELVVMAETIFSLSPIDQLTEPDRYVAHIYNDNVYGSLHDVQPQLAWRMRYVPFYKFVVVKHSYYKASMLGWQSRLAKSNWSDPLKGFTPKNKMWEKSVDSLNRVGGPLMFTIDSAIVRAYKETVQGLRRKGRKVLIVIPPFQEDGLRLLPGLDKLRKTFADLQGDGVYFRDYSLTEMSAEKKYFYNNSHVNSLGADRFTEKVALAIDSILNKPKEIK
jgi:hypothetical protein